MRFHLVFFQSVVYLRCNLGCHLKCLSGFIYVFFRLIHDFFRVRLRASCRVSYQDFFRVSLGFT